MVKGESSLAPIVIFGFNRPNHIQICLDALSKSKLADQSDLHIYIDGAIYEDGDANNRAVVEICQRFQWPGLKKQVTIRKSNIGLAKNIISGVTEVCSAYGSVIVIEDDIVVAPDFLVYMNSALDFYAVEQRIMHINGYTPETSGQWLLPAQFFSRFMHCWGWATWNVHWVKLMTDSKTLLERISERKDRKEFNLNNSINMEDQLVKNISGEMNTWAIKWSATIFLEEGLCVSPKVSLVRNIGLDGSGIHHSTKSKGPHKSQINEIGKFNEIEALSIKKGIVGPLYFEMHYTLGNRPNALSVVKFFVKKTIGHS